MRWGGQTRYDVEVDSIRSSAYHPASVSLSVPRDPVQSGGGGTVIPVLASLEQVATGLRIARGDASACDECDDTLRDGDPVVAVLSRTSAADRWSVDCRFCDSCGRAYALDVRGSALVAGRVGVISDAVTQSSWACLVDPTPRSALLRRPDVDDRDDSAGG